MVIFVSLRMAASAEAPSGPMPLPDRLRARGRMGNGERVGVSMGADTKANTWGALQAGNLRLLEVGGERRGALDSDIILPKTASEGRSGNGGRASVSTGADKKVGATVRRGESRLRSLAKGVV